MTGGGYWSQGAEGRCTCLFSLSACMSCSIHSCAFLQLFLAARANPCTTDTLLIVLEFQEICPVCPSASSQRKDVRLYQTVKFLPRGIAHSLLVPLPRIGTFFGNKMGSVMPAKPVTNPWVETPLIESSVLSKAAGW